MPVFVGEFLSEPVYLLRFLAIMAPVARLAATGPEPVAECLVRCGEVLERFGGINRPSPERGASRYFCQVACQDDHVFQLPSEISG
jgi:hypothetical protein